MSQKTIERVSLISAATCCAVFLTALCLPALTYARDPATDLVESYPGIALLALGWIEATNGSISGIAWMANPCFLIGTSALVIRRFGGATGFCILACVLASASFDIKSVCINEGGTEAAVVGLGPGFWLWYSGMIFGGFASVTLLLMTLRLQRLNVATLLTEEDFIEV